MGSSSTSPTCAACGRPLAPRDVLCMSCVHSLDTAEPMLQGCVPGLDRMWSLTAKIGVASDLLAALRGPQTTRAAEFIAECIEQLAPATMLTGDLVPVPQSQADPSGPGPSIDPAAELAVALAARIGAQVSPCLKPPSRRDRTSTNLISTGDAAPRNSLLVTDAVDTAILTACANALRAAGSYRVAAIAFARSD